ncbi:MAG: DpnI domain-containing protein [Clostridia bacterium]|nr:DpnI domain-containing protein [Clostridia bacterium]
MNLEFNLTLAEGYKSKSQISRRVTEGWIAASMYCPRCGHAPVKQFANNKPVADFFCEACASEFELKSKANKLGNTIADGAYDTMIERITSNANPDFFFLGYNRKTMKVKELIVVPKCFFVPSIIKKRTPLNADARRAGWTGCNILISKIPRQGRIPIIVDEIERSKESVIHQLSKAKRFETYDVEGRGWLFDVLNCLNEITEDVFSLQDVYAFSKILSQKHPQNNNVEAKIRQQLQMLRDKDYIEFLGKGQYRKVNN